MKPVLCVYANRHQAMTDGFTGPNMRHPTEPDLKAWWPDMGSESIRGMEFSAAVGLDNVPPNVGAFLRTRVRL